MESILETHLIAYTSYVFKRAKIPSNFALHINDNTTVEYNTPTDFRTQETVVADPLLSVSFIIYHKSHTFKDIDFKFSPVLENSISLYIMKTNWTFIAQHTQNLYEK